MNIQNKQNNFKITSKFALFNSKYYGKTNQTAVNIMDSLKMC